MSVDASGVKSLSLIDDVASKTLPRLASRSTLRTVDESLS